MSRVLIVGAGPGLGAALAAALCRSGVVLVAREHVEQAADAFELGSGLLIEAMRPPPPERAPVYPESRPNLRNFAISQLPATARTNRRPREQRTRRGG